MVCFSLENGYAIVTERGDSAKWGILFGHLSTVPLAFWLWRQMWTPPPEIQGNHGADFPHIPVLSFAWVSWDRSAGGWRPPSPNQAVEAPTQIKTTRGQGIGSSGMFLEHILIRKWEANSSLLRETQYSLKSFLLTSHLKNRAERHTYKKTSNLLAKQILFPPLPRQRTTLNSVPLPTLFQTSFSCPVVPPLPREHDACFPLLPSNCSCNYLFMPLFGKCPQLN